MATQTPEAKALAMAQARYGRRAFVRRITGDVGQAGWFRICRPLRHRESEIVEFGSIFAN